MKKILCLFLALTSVSGVVHGDIAWETPVSISTTSVNASDPHTIIDVNGNSTAVWVENSVIKASYMPAGGSWSYPPSTLSNIANTALSPRVAIDGSGNVTAVWIESTQLATAVLSGGIWGAETILSSGTGVSSFSNVVDSSGNAVVVYEQSGGIYALQRSSGTWSAHPSTLATANSSNPHVAISNFGTALAAWHTVNSGSDILAYSILTVSSGTWATAKNVFSTSALLNNYPKVALDANGNGYLVWFRYSFLNGITYENVQVAATTMPQGAGSWSIAQLLDSPGLYNPADLTIKIKVDDDGDVMVAWNNSYDGETFTILASERLFGAQSFQQPAILNYSIYSFGMDFAVANDSGVMSYMQWDGVSNTTIQSQQTDTNNPIFQNWTFPNPYSTGSDNAYPSVGFSVTGTTYNAVSVWLNYNGTNIAVNASTGSDGVLAPPTNVSATQSNTNFGVFIDYYNTITWTASTDPSVQEYNLYRNGVYFTSVNASTTSFVDHNQEQVPPGTVTYGVAAYTFDNRQSSITSFTL